MVALILTGAGLVLAASVPFLVEVYKGTRAVQQQSYIAGISACAEQTPSIPPAPAGYCHLKYVIRNNSGNAIHRVIVIQPRWRPLQPIALINAGDFHEELDPGLRREEPVFASYPVGIIFEDSQGRLWYKHHVAERVKQLADPPRTVHDFVPYKNPLGMVTVARRVAGGIAVVFVLATIAFGMVNVSNGAKNEKTSPSPLKQSSTGSTTEGSNGR